MAAKTPLIRDLSKVRVKVKDVDLCNDSWDEAGVSFEYEAPPRPEDRVLVLETRVGEYVHGFVTQSGWIEHVYREQVRTRPWSEVTDDPASRRQLEATARNLGVEDGAETERVVLLGLGIAAASCGRLLFDTCLELAWSWLEGDGEPIVGMENDCLYALYKGEKP